MYLFLFIYLENGVDSMEFFFLIIKGNKIKYPINEHVFIIKHFPIFFSFLDECVIGHITNVF